MFSSRFHAVLYCIFMLFALAFSILPLLKWRQRTFTLWDRAAQFPFRVRWDRPISNLQTCSCTVSCLTLQQTMPCLLIASVCSSHLFRWLYWLGFLRSGITLLNIRFFSGLLVYKILTYHSWMLVFLARRSDANTLLSHVPVVFSESSLPRLQSHPGIHAWPECKWWQGQWTSVLVLNRIRACDKTNGVW